MINAKELMLGNKVKTKAGQLLTVSTLQFVPKGNYPYFEKGYIIIDFYENKIGGLITSSEDDNVDPIKLTVDIIESSGFKKQQSGYYKDPFFIYLPGGSSSNYGFGVKGSGVTRSIKYVHELQNVFFILSGQELEINIP